jgi:hypothetical protein
MIRLLLLVTLLFSCVTANAQRTTPVNTCTDASSYGSLAEAIATLGSATKSCLAYSDTQSLRTDITVPPNITLVREGAGLITGAHTLTIQGPFVSDPVQAWNSNVIVSLSGNNSIGPILPQWWGAVGDGATDSLTAIQAAATAAATVSGTLYFSATSLGYKISGALTFANNIDVEMNNSFLVYTGSSDITALTIGTTGAQTFKRTYRGLRVKRNTISDWSSESNIGIKVYNAADCFMEIREVNGFTIGVQALADGGKGFLYNQLQLDMIINNKVALDVTSQTSGSSPNQNIFYGGRFSQNSSINPGKSRIGIRFSKAIGAYDTPNNNLFVGPSFELWQADADTTGITGAITTGTASLVVSSATGWVVGDYLTLNGSAQTFKVANIAGTTFTLDANSDVTLAGGAVKGVALPVLVQVAALANRIEGARNESNGPIFVREEAEAHLNQYGLLYDQSAVVQSLRRQAFVLSTPRNELMGAIRESWESGNIPSHTTAVDKGTYFTLNVDGIHIEDFAGGGTMDLIAGQGIAGPPEQYLKLTGGTAVGVVVDTTRLKRFVVRRQVSSASPGRVAIRAYDGHPLFGGTIITSGADLVRGFNSGVDLAWNAGSFGGAYVQGSDQSSDFFFSVDDSIKFIAVLIYNQAQVSSFSIHSLDEGALNVFPGHGRGAGRYMNALPDYGRYFAGQEILKSNPASGQTEGWRVTTGGYGAATAWANGQTIAGTYQVRKNGGNVYLAASTGTTGATPPTHTSGTVSDGGVNWTYLGPLAALTAKPNL